MTTLDHERLAVEARTAAHNAYAPYSGFRVGAVAVSEDGSLYRGVNVENAAYPSGLCAEGAAIAAAAAAGVHSLEAVAVACIDADSVDGAYPCGQCRQRMVEFGVATVIVTAGGGEVRVHDLDDLIPYGFRLEP